MTHLSSFFMRPSPDIFMLPEMVRQGGHLAKVQDLEKFRNSRRRGFLSCRQVQEEGVGKVGQRGEELVAGEEMRFQVSNFLCKGGGLCGPR